jgi:hypothetical protein
MKKARGRRRPLAQSLPPRGANPSARLRQGGGASADEVWEGRRKKNLEGFSHSEWPPLPRQKDARRSCIQIAPFMGFFIFILSQEETALNKPCVSLQLVVLCTVLRVHVLNA